MNRRVIMLRILVLAILIPYWYFLQGVYHKHTSTFGCIDDCFNYGAAYFLNSGKKLYTDIYYDHQPVPAYISAWVQKFTRPDSLYALVYQHRMFVFWWSSLWGALLVLRFGLSSALFVVLFEATKWHIFGDRFLGESLIVYPLAYLFTTAWYAVLGKRTGLVDLVFAAFLTWFVIFTREPYVPLSITLFMLLLWQNRSAFATKVSLVLFLFLTVTTVLQFSLHDYVFQLWVNAVSSVRFETSERIFAGGLPQSFLYPMTLWFGGLRSDFYTIERLVSILFLIMYIWHTLRLKTIRPLLFLVLALGLANLRPVQPGTVYGHTYVAYRSLVWYGLFLVSTTTLLSHAYNTDKSWLARIGILGYITVVIFAITSPGSPIRYRGVGKREFELRYGWYSRTGETIRLLSKSTDTLFLENWDGLLYWQSKRVSPYRYAWYESWFMEHYPTFRNAYATMFETNPPTFYYSHCSVTSAQTSLPLKYADSYVRLDIYGKPSCLFVHKTTIRSIRASQWESVRQYGYENPLPNEATSSM